VKAPVFIDFLHYDPVYPTRYPGCQDYWIQIAGMVGGYDYPACFGKIFNTYCFQAEKYLAI
jgi:hypothetical protein